MELNKVNLDGREPIRVMIVVDNPALCEALRALLLTFHDLQVVGTVLDGYKAPGLCAELAPDVVLLDTFVPVSYGATIARMIKDRRPEVQIIRLFSRDRDANTQPAFGTGAHCSLPRCVSVDEIVSSVRANRLPRDPTFVYE